MLSCWTSSKEEGKKKARKQAEKASTFLYQFLVKTNKNTQPKSIIYKFISGPGFSRGFLSYPFLVPVDMDTVRMWKGHSKNGPLRNFVLRKAKFCVIEICKPATYSVQLCVCWDFQQVYIFVEKALTE